MKCSLHANTTFRASTFTRKFEMDTMDTDSILLRRFDAKTATRDKFDESVRLTRFHDLYRDVYTIDTCYMLSRRAEGKMMLSH